MRQLTAKTTANAAPTSGQMRTILESESRDRTAADLKRYRTQLRLAIGRRCQPFQGSQQSLLILG
jgi:hypothetical protein